MIKKNKQKGRVFEGKVKEAFDSFCFTYKSGVSTKGVDLIAITSLEDNLNVIFLIEVKDRKDGFISNDEIRSIIKNYSKDLNSIANKTNLIPIPILVLKKQNENNTSYLLGVFNPLDLDYIYLFGYFKLLREVVFFLQHSLYYIISELYEKDKHKAFEVFEKENVIGFKRINLKEIKNKSLKLSL
jgi:hypothetical protein